MQARRTYHLDLKTVFQRPGQIINRAEKLDAGDLVLQIEINPAIFGDSEITKLSFDDHRRVSEFQRLVKQRHKVGRR